MNTTLYTLEKYLVSLVDIELANINENGKYVDIKEGVVKPTRVKNNFMATLNWIGKEAVVNHDKEAPFKLLGISSSELLK